MHVPSEFVALEYLLHDMRLFKSREELRMMRQAAAINVRAHLRARDAMLRPNLTVVGWIR